MNHSDIEKLAALTVQIGVNVQPGQPVIINSPIEGLTFARQLAAQAYAAGAADVIVNFSDQHLARMRYDHVDIKRLTTIPPWQKDRYQWFLDQNAAIISVHADDPSVFKGVDAEKIKATANAVQQATENYHQAIITNARRWCVISAPTPGWAKTVFPTLSEEAAVKQLWNAICKATRTDLDDPVAAWKKHNANLKRKCDFLNAHQFKKMVYRNSLGTNFSVEMPKNHVWAGGSETAKDGVDFFPNMPTEEIFSAPHKDSANGTLVASYPLIYQGQYINRFSLTFKDGVVVDYHAETGQDALESLITCCPNSNRLGEIALVPARSPISEMNLLFYNTLFDENASCHFALGSAYPDCVQGGAEMSLEEREAAGLNNCNAHADFMVGTKDLSITGINADGSETPVFVNGNWAF